MVSKKYLASKHKDIKIYTLAVDSGLNDSLFIVSGLGDAGDRSLGVEPF
ncbi:MAG: uracil phosphoribosyltransferase [Caldisphaera sp.]|jgi:uracil phosphoribosyltransferase|nr:uracil phosphoribosyltransferase [Caldisphaera sp.]